MATSNNHDFHVVALLIRGKSIVNISTNSRKTDPCARRSFDGDIFLHHLHAEMKALKKSKPGDALVVIRFTKAGNVKIAKPCVFCQQHIRNKKISEVYYSDDDGEMKLLSVE